MIARGRMRGRFESTNKPSLIEYIEGMQLAFADALGQLPRHKTLRSNCLSRLCKIGQIGNCLAREPTCAFANCKTTFAVFRLEKIFARSFLTFGRVSRE